MRVKPQKLIQGRRRTPNGDHHRRADFHARGLATRAVLEKRKLAVCYTLCAASDPFPRGRPSH